MTTSICTAAFLQPRQRLKEPLSAHKSHHKEQIRAESCLTTAVIDPRLMYFFLQMMPVRGMMSHGWLEVLSPLVDMLEPTIATRPQTHPQI